MASMYALYIQERTNDFILENSHGFASYRFLNDGKTVYIVDIYVLPELRGVNVASQLADEICMIAKRDRGSNEVIGTVVPSAKNSNTSLKVLLGYGMTLSSSDKDLIVFRKDL